MKRVSFVALCVVALVAAVFSGETRKAEAVVTCTVTKLSVCLPALTTPTPASEVCCSKLTAQQACLCGYLKDPDFGQYVKSPNVKKVFSTCGIPFPKCD